jgi:predicted AAA+ superfamily ATPase
VRNLLAFEKFLEALSYSHGELINHTNIGRECGVSTKTVMSYFQILVDSMMGHFVLPYHRSSSRRTVSQSPKFYLFDVGLANFLVHRQVTALKGREAGRALEHLIFCELNAYQSYHRTRQKVRFWRTHAGHEVDFIIGDAQFAIEVKISDHVRKEDLKGLLMFLKEYPQSTAIVVSNDPRPRLLKLDGKEVNILPVEMFLEKLWAGDLNAA